MCMDRQLLTLFTLTFVINLVGTLAYSARIAGVRTGRVAVSLSLFNVLMLVSRTANGFLGPLLAKRMERAMAVGGGGGVADLRWLLVAAALATAVGALLTPTFQRLLTRAVAGFAVHRSMPRLIVYALSPAGLAQMRAAVTLPRGSSLTTLTGRSRPPSRVLISNAVATAVWTVGVFASLYAGYLQPTLRVTSSQLSSIVNGVATLLLFVVVDPYLSLLTDDVMEGRSSESLLRRSVTWFLGTRLLGTALAQALLMPAAFCIAAAAQRI
jgi:Amj-like protein